MRTLLPSVCWHRPHPKEVIVCSAVGIRQARPYQACFNRLNLLCWCLCRILQRQNKLYESVMHHSRRTCNIAAWHSMLKGSDSAVMGAQALHDVTCSPGSALRAANPRLLRTMACQQGPSYCCAVARCIKSELDREHMLLTNACFKVKLVEQRRKTDICDHITSSETRHWVLRL